MLFTTFVIYFALVLCALCVWASYRHVSDAANIVHDVRTSRGRLISNEAAIESLTAQLQKLRGQFHAFKVNVEDTVIADYHLQPDPHDAIRVPVPGVPGASTAPYCENYGLAQREGPRSEAASCECGYCVEMRARRSMVKAALIPKTASEQAKHAKDAANGQE